MPSCSTCKQDKPVEDFYKWAHNSFGHTSRCKPCHQESNKKWNGANRTKRSEAARKRLQRPEVKAKAQAGSRKWRESNLEYDAHRQHLRRATKLKATPKWVDAEELFLIEEVYNLASLRSKMTGFKWHVDHIVPLKYKLASGLHCIHNLQVIPWITNLQKRNLYIG